MSGIEVAGIVLALLPCITAALAKYAAGVSRVKDGKRYEKELRSVLLTIDTEVLLYRDNCHLLDLEDECGRRYRDAVEICLFPNFDCKSTDLEDEGVSSAVYTGVVFTLEEELNQFRTGLPLFDICQ